MGSGSMELARVTNGFLDGRSGFRGLTINVVFRSTIHPDVSMICEVRLTLNSLLYEEKKLGPIFEILSQETLFSTITGAEEEGGNTSKGPDLSMLKFEPILNVKKSVEVKNSIKDYYKCAAHSELQLVAMNIMGYRIAVCDMVTQKVLFRTDVDRPYSQHWISMKGQPTLAVQSSNHCIKFFDVDPTTKAFTESETCKV